jgi:putative glycosyltransferase (TIGR04372 family)
LPIFQTWVGRIQQEKYCIFNYLPYIEQVKKKLKFKERWYAFIWLLNHIWIRFLRAVKNRDYPALAQKFISAGLLLLGLLCAVPTVLILWVLKPVFWLKVGMLSSARLGHLAMNTDLFLRRRQLGIYPDGPFYCFICNPTKLANRQLLTMFKRVLPICESRALTLVFLGMRPLLKRTPFHQGLPFLSNEYYEFNNAKPSLYFTPDEIEKGRKLLNQMNVDFDRDKFVCIFARDDAYLNNWDPHINWEYHNVRDTDIDNLIGTAKYLIDKGYVVIRIGSIVKKPINFSHEKMIDYPFSGHRSEFLDIFLIAHCKLLIASGISGVCNVANIFDTPLLEVNASELVFPPFGKDCLYIPSKYKLIKTGDYLKFKDALKLRKFWFDLAKFDLEKEESSTEDKIEATQEILARLEGTFRYSPESEILIQAYHELWEKSGTTGSPNKTPIGIAWLKRNQDLFF